MLGELKAKIDTLKLVLDNSEKAYKQLVKYASQERVEIKTLGKDYEDFYEVKVYFGNSLFMDEEITNIMQSNGFEIAQQSEICNECVNIYTIDLK